MLLPVWALLVAPVAQRTERQTETTRSSAQERSVSALFHRPSLVGESNYTHFWMPEPLFRGV